MVAGFRRSISLPRPKTSAGRTAAQEKPYHVRSTSLPTRSHPLISQIDDELRAARAWQSTSSDPAGPPAPSAGAWLCSGLARLDLLYLSLDDLLRLPQVAESLRRNRGGAAASSSSSGLAERLLDDLLRFADAFGSFRSAMVSLQELQAAAQAAVRRRDRARLASVSRSLREAEKEVAALASALREASGPAEPTLAAAASGSSGAAGAVLARVLREVEAVTVSVSDAVFQGTAAALSSATAAVAPKPSSCWRALRRRLAPAPPAAFSSKKKGSRTSVDGEVAAATEEGEEWARRASERLQAVEQTVAGLERGSEKVYRTLINSRVSLLNILTP